MTKTPTAAETHEDLKVALLSDIDSIRALAFMYAHLFESVGPGDDGLDLRELSPGLAVIAGHVGDLTDSIEEKVNGLFAKTAGQ